MGHLRKEITCVLLASLLPLSASDFINLGFEDARTDSLVFEGNPPSYGSAWGKTADLLPGWEFSYENPSGTVTWDTLLFDSRALGFPYASLITRTEPLAPGVGQYVLELAPLTGTPDDGQFRLRQSGEVPADAQYLTFYDSSRRAAVLVNGQKQAEPNAASGDYRQFPISQYAGQSVDLELIVSKFASSPVWSPVWVDDLKFSGVPEPSKGALLLLGGMGLYWAARQRRV